MANFSDFVFSAHSATPPSHLSHLDCSQFQVYNTCSLSMFLFFFLFQSPLRLRSCHLCIALELGFKLLFNHLQISYLHAFK